MLHFQLYNPTEFYKGPETTALAETGISPFNLGFGRYFLFGCPFERIFTTDISVLAEDLAARLIAYSKSAGEWVGTSYPFLRDMLFGELGDYDFLMSEYVEKIPSKKPAPLGFQERRKFIPSSKILMHLRKLPGEASEPDLTDLLSPVLSAMKREGFLVFADRLNYVVACSSQVIIPTSELIYLVHRVQKLPKLISYTAQRRTS